MKKKILLGLSCLLMVLPHTTNAKTDTIQSITDENNSANAPVTVGEVDTPVYDVEITWSEFKFNWKYDSTKDEYYWEEDDGNDYDVVKVSEEDSFDEEYFANYKASISTDDKCENFISEDVTYDEIMEEPENYYLCHFIGSYNTNNIEIIDNTVAARIYPYIKWSSEDKYDYVQAKFSYNSSETTCTAVVDENDFNRHVNMGLSVYSDSNCTQKVLNNTEYQPGLYKFNYSYTIEELTSEKVPDSARQNIEGKNEYYFYVNLENKENPTNFPEPGDLIGTITITIDNK